MFTGIIEELGTVAMIRADGRTGKLTVQASTVVEHLRLGDSVAVNGVCLTVTGLGHSQFTADFIGETFERTTLGGLRAGEYVNLERAARLGDPVGEHLVQGHVDARGTVRKKQHHENGVTLLVALQAELLSYVVPQGSIALDGVSLTVVDVDEETFTVGLIPHTLQTTTLQYRRVGDRLNVEVDILAKYVRRFLKNDLGSQDSEDTGYKTQSLTRGLLREHGFLEPQ
jgi:riboflavin synthase